jgi:hypothetical protein
MGLHLLFKSRNTSDVKALETSLAHRHFDFFENLGEPHLDCFPHMDAQHRPVPLLRNLLLYSQVFAACMCRARGAGRQRDNRERVRRLRCFRKQRYVSPVELALHLSLYSCPVNGIHARSPNPPSCVDYDKGFTGLSISFLDAGKGPGW